MPTWLTLLLLFYLTDFKRGHQAIFGELYLLIEGTLVTLALHQFHTQIEKVLTLGSIIIRPLLCWKNTCFAFIVYLSRMWWCLTRVIMCKLMSSFFHPAKEIYVCVCIYIHTHIYIYKIFYKHGSENINHMLTSSDLYWKTQNGRVEACTSEKQKKDMAVAKHL